MPRSPRSDSKLQQEMADPEYTLLDVLDVGAIKGWPEAALVKEVERRLGAGEAVDQHVDRSSTPLMTAAANGWPSVVRVLLAHHANPFQKNRWNEDVLSSAKLGKNIEVIALIEAARATAGKDGRPGRTQPSAPTKLSPPDFIKGRYSKKSAFALICSNQPSRVDTDQLAELFFPESHGAGAIEPPTGLGKKVFTSRLMEETSGNVPIAVCHDGMRELKRLAEQYIDVLGYEQRSVLYALTEEAFFDAVTEHRWKFVKFVEVEDG